MQTIVTPSVKSASFRLTTILPRVHVRTAFCEKRNNRISIPLVSSPHLEAVVEEEVWGAGG